MNRTIDEDQYEPLYPVSEIVFDNRLEPPRLLLFAPWATASASSNGPGTFGSTLRPYGGTSSRGSRR
jgi:hypothetical protein